MSPAASLLLALALFYKAVRIVAYSRQAGGYAHICVLPGYVSICVTSMCDDHSNETVNETVKHRTSTLMSCNFFFCRP